MRGVGKALEVGKVKRREDGTKQIEPIRQTNSRRELLKYYRQAQRAYQDDHEFREDADYQLAIAISAEKARAAGRPVFESVMREVFGFDLE